MMYLFISFLETECKSAVGDFAFLIKDITVKKEQNSGDFISLNNK